MMITICGHTFEGTLITQWLKKEGKCPICKKNADISKLQKNFALADLSSHYLWWYLSIQITIYIKILISLIIINNSVSNQVFFFQSFSWCQKTLIRTDVENAKVKIWNMTFKAFWFVKTVELWKKNYFSMEVLYLEMINKCKARILT